MRRARIHALTAAIVGAALIVAALADSFTSSKASPSQTPALLPSEQTPGSPHFPAIDPPAMPRRDRERSTYNPPLDAFRAWTERYQRSRLHERRALVAEGIVLARQRRIKMQDLIRRDPLAALHHAIPSAVRRSVPAEVAAHLEERIAAQGHLTAIAGPAAAAGHDCRFERRVFLNDGRSFDCSVYGRRLSQTTEYDVWVHGIALDGTMAVHESPVRLLDAGETPDPGKPMVTLCPTAGGSAGVLAEVAGKVYAFCNPDEASAMAAAFVAAEDQAGPLVRYPALAAGNITAETAAGLDPAWTLGAKDVLYLRVDFPDRPGPPIGPTEASNMLCGEVDRFYRDASFERTRLTCTIPERVYRAPQPAAWYATNDFFWQLFLDVSDLAAADGYNMDDYDRVLTAFTGLADIPRSRFTRAAWAFIGGKHAWFNGFFTASLTAHELGHNYGVHHANFWRTFDGDIVGPGGTEEYGDPLDIMGTAPDARGHFNPWFKHMLLWLDDGDVQTVAVNGTYRVHRFDHPASTGVRALKVARGDGRNYWISLRQLFTGHPTIFNGAYIIWGYNRDSIQSDLLDMSPGGGQNDAGLPIGSLFEDTDAGIAIRPIAKGGSQFNEYLDVEISFFVVGLNEAVDALSLTVRTGGVTPWRRQSIVTHDGIDAAESGTLEDNEDSWIETTVNGPGTLSFWWQVSSEVFDSLQFSTNGTWVTQISGEVPWQQRTYHLGAGSHTLRWRYSKNASQASGEDKAWLDQVTFVSSPCTIVALEAESASLLTPMAIASSSEASDGEYILSSADNAGTATWSLDLPKAGPYVLWGRVLALDTSGDSFLVSANGSAEDIYDIARTTGDDWQWTRVNGRGGGDPWSIDPRIFNLMAGQNTITFRAREAGARLDRLIVTCDTNFVPSDGPVITVAPQSVDLFLGESASLQVSARGFQPLSYQWRFEGENLVEGPNVTGTRTPVLNLNNVPLSQGGVYTVVVTNRFGTALVDTVVTVRPPVASFGVFADLSFVATTNVENSLQLLGFSAAGFTNLAGAVGVHRQIVMPSLLRDLGAELTPGDRAALSNFVHDGGKLIVHGSFYHHGSTLLNAVFDLNLVSSRQSDEATPFSRMPGVVGTEFQDDPTKIPVNMGTTALFTTSLPPTARSLYERNGQAAVALVEWGGGTIIFLGWDWQNAPPLGTADGGWLALLESAARQTVPLAGSLPVLVREPISQPATLGEAVTFRARAEGTPPLAYQWLKNGFSLGGATNAHYTIGHVQPTDAGAYSVLVSNQFGVALSSNAALAVVSSTAYANASSIVIPDGGTASPYPSRITVAGLAGTFLGVSVTLSNFAHSYPDDVDVLLVGPGGQTALLLSDAGGSMSVSGLSLTFRDFAADWIGDDGPLTSGFYRTSEYLSDDLFLPPAPRGPYGSTLEPFKAADPNGVWSLYVFDDAGGDDGAISGGWGLRFWMDDSIKVSTTLSASNIVLHWPATTNSAYRVVYRDNLSEESWRPLLAPVSIVDGMATAQDLLQSQRFYRVEVFGD